MSKRRKYSNDAVFAAVNFAKENKNFSVRKVAREFGVPETTLRNKINGKFKVNTPLGRPPVISFSLEEKLADHCAFMAQVGYGYTKWQVIDIAMELANATGVSDKFKNDKPSKRWFDGFVGRFPNMVLKNPQKLERVRAICVSPTTVESYFKELKLTLTETDLIDQPSRIWNIDETGITCDYNPPKILASRYTRVNAVTNGKSPTTTVIACGNAIGHRLPPYIIYKGERLCKELVSDGLPDTKYTTSATGWSNSDTFLDFFKNHFLKYVNPPAIVLYDGHLTHITFDVIREARLVGIHIFVLPPHSSHILQPLDVGIFSPFKRTFSALCHQYIDNNINNVITRYQLPKLIGKSYDKALSPGNLQSAFRAAGIHPYNPQTVIAKLPKKTAEKGQNTKYLSRNERREVHEVKQMFIEKEKKTELELSETPVKADPKQNQSTSRRLFIPKCGKAVTSEDFFKLVQDKTEYDQQKSKDIEEKKNKRLEKQREKDLKGKKSSEKTGKTKKSSSLKRSSENDDRYDSDSPHKRPCREGTSQEAGPSGKTNVFSDNSSLHEEEKDTELCVVCHKWSPPAFKLSKSIRLLDWGQCDKCSGWVHLQFCCPVTSLDKDEEFLCPKCL